MIQPKQEFALGVGIAGLGAIGMSVAKALDSGEIEGLRLAAVTSGDRKKAEQRAAALQHAVTVTTIGKTITLSDVIVECVPKSAFLEIAEPVLRAGKTLVTVSGAAILEHPEVIAIARDHGGRIVLATGALLGLDAIRAASEGRIHSVSMVTRKPPKSLQGAPYLELHNIDVFSITKATRIFKGTAAEGAVGFPSNVNVAAAVGLAGIGAENTSLEIWADPKLDRNNHSISVDADSASFEMSIANVPTEENPGTGKITALSVIAALRAEFTSFRVGS